MKLTFTLGDARNGALIYATGDTIASAINHEVTAGRILGVALLGATLYALEIPNWFAWIDRRTSPSERTFARSVVRAGLAMAWFNPLWIARHLALVNVFAGDIDEISWALLGIGARSFVVNIPISLAGNYLIQNVLSPAWRFRASSTFSALLAVYYAMSEVWFA